MIITPEEYYMGRDKTYSLYLSIDTKRNVVRTCEIVSKMLIIATVANVTFHKHPKTGTIVSSGWRPPQVNSSVGGATRSAHLTGEAVDLYDPEGELDDFLIGNPKLLVDLGLWQEHPDYTITWCHVQTRPTKSGKRVFIP